AAATQVLDRLGITALTAPGAGCCGAVSQHLSAPEDALDFARRNIDAWWPLVEDGAETLVMTASGCGAMVRDYGHLLRNDPVYAPKAARISAITRDIAEVVAAEDISALRPAANAPRRIAFQSPCTLQHGQQLGGVVEGLLDRLGFELTPVADAHLCCGSAGTYSIVQPQLSERLRANKLAALQAGEPALIATANIGCLHHLQSATALQVRHWIELLVEHP
ncbi:MAG: glycolate oxidase subunit GlcF, partial [Gammaproteobacteria bacterium]